MIVAESPPASGSFQLELPLFSGPLDDLLRLVAERRLSTEDLAVSEVATQFAGYLESRASIDLDETGEFLAAAARLLLLKSSRILAQPLPVEPESTDSPARISWLERPALESLAGRLGASEGAESIVPAVPPFVLERRSAPHSAETLRKAWEDMRKRQGRAPAAVSIPAFVRLETAVSGLIRRLKSSARLSFLRLIRDANRQDAVIYFLAVLELVRQRQAVVTQVDPFAEITLDYVERPVEAASRTG